jgi:hypothetical protein
MKVICIFNTHEVIFLDTSNIFFLSPILALSDEERLLFRELINVCDKKINPGLLKLKWSTDISEKYFSDCSLHISEVTIIFSYIFTVF